MDGPNDHEARVTFRSRQRLVSVRVPLSDMDQCIVVSPWRAFLTVLSIVLVVTDIPRTGLTFNLSNEHNRVGPGLVMCWGPYEYAVAHLNATTPTSIHASCDGAPLETLEVWAYKFDSLSIAPRALAAWLNVSSYPPCLLYHKRCASPQLAPGTVFHMYDGLVTAMQRAYFPRHQRETRPFVFLTKSNWIDRLHQFVFRSLTKNPEIRLHSVFHRTSIHQERHGMDMFGLCESHGHDDRAMPFVSRPILCDHPILWKCDHPIEPTGERGVPIWNHIEIRIADLQRRYPALALDLTLFVTTIVEQSHSDRNIIPTVIQTTDALEITTLIRGRQCDGDSTICETVFVDDYRYERVVQESDVDVWAPYLVVLRGVSQTYMWLRVALLIAGCYSARAAEPAYRRRSAWSIALAAGQTLVKIPGHTIVYGSWLPMLGYAIAHHFDSALIHMMGEYAWSSIGGFFDFHPIDYMLSASIQMRNLWMIVIIWKVLLGSYSALTTRCHHSTNFERSGILAFRPGWLNLISWLTTISLARSLAFRDTQVVQMVELPRHTPVSMFQQLATYRNFSDYGVRYDLRVAVAASVLVLGSALYFGMAVKLVTGRPSSLLVCRSFYVPLSAGRLWLRSATDTYWSFTFRKPSHNSSAGPPRIEPSSVSPTASFTTKNEMANCSVCARMPTPFHWRSTDGCKLHEPIFHIRRRSKEIWSMVRLTNIAIMTDPIVLFQLYVIGKSLYVYHVPQSGAHAPYEIVLPTSPVETISQQACTIRGSSSSAGLEWVGVVNSRDVPWHVLVNCG